MLQKEMEKCNKIIESLKKKIEEKDQDIKLKIQELRDEFNL
jgi:prefoldin subunit 5